MNILSFDSVAGAAGDMVLAALFDLGADPEPIEQILKDAGLAGFHIRFRHDRDRHGFTAAYCDVLLDDTGDEHEHRHSADSVQHGHSHGHAHTHSHEEDRDPAHPHAGSSGPGNRALPDIEKLIQSSTAPNRAKDRAFAIFRRLAEAEAAVHGMPIEEVHFHEVGGVDAIVDIFGTCLALEQLDIDRVLCAGFKIGRGTVECAHGTLPVPSPATARLLEGQVVERLDIQAELTTPTGAAILTALSNGSDSGLSGRCIGCGIGHGHRDLAERPNIMRAFLFEQQAGAPEVAVEVLESDIDDESPEVLGHLAEKLLDAGALDVNMQAVYMKKGRLGTRLAAVVGVGRAEAVAQMILAHSSTLGVRISPARRICLERTEVEAETPWGTVRAKRAVRADGDEIIPEYDACRALALKTGVPLRRILAAARRWTGTHDGLGSSTSNRS